MASPEFQLALDHDPYNVEGGSADKDLVLKVMGIVHALSSQPAESLPGLTVQPSMLEGGIEISFEVPGTPSTRFTLRYIAHETGAFQLELDHLKALICLRSGAVLLQGADKPYLQNQPSMFLQVSSSRPHSTFYEAELPCTGIPEHLLLQCLGYLHGHVPPEIQAGIMTILGEEIQRRTIEKNAPAAVAYAEETARESAALREVIEKQRRSMRQWLVLCLFLVATGAYEVVHTESRLAEIKELLSAQEKSLQTIHSSNP